MQRRGDWWGQASPEETLWAQPEKWKGITAWRSKELSRQSGLQLQRTTSGKGLVGSGRSEYNVTPQAWKAEWGYGKIEQGGRGQVLQALQTMQRVWISFLAQHKNNAEVKTEQCHHPIPYSFEKEYSSCSLKNNLEETEAGRPLPHPREE